MDHVGGVEHLPVADGHAADVLLVGVLARLVERLMDRSFVPSERAGPLGFDYQPLDSGAREDDVRPFDLPVDVLGRPVEYGREQHAKDLLRGALGNATEAVALDEVSSTEVSETRPRRADTVTAPLLQNQHLRHGKNVPPAGQSRCRARPGVVPA